MKIFSPSGFEIYDIQVDDKSVRYRSIMNDDSLTLFFSLTGTVSIPVGSYVEFEGQRYRLYYPENLKKINSRNFEYTLTLHGAREALKLYHIKDISSKPYGLKFSLTAKPATFLKLLVDVLNIHDNGWKVGDCIDATEKTISFNHESCLDALTRIAQEFNTEYEFVNKTVHLRKVEHFKDAPLALSYGKGNGFKSGVGRTNDGDKQPLGRLYVQGGERNIDYSKYKSKTLLLPKSASLQVDGKTYRTDADGMYITRMYNNNPAEGSYDASNIYPHRVGTVSEVITVDASKNLYDIKDSSIPESLNFRSCQIPGEKATIKFETGALAGREFDIYTDSNGNLTGYIHAERRFKIVPQEIDSVIMPGGVFIPAVGDKYAIFNVALPSAYIADDATKTGASWDMFREAVRYFAENEEPKFIFTGELDGIWSKSRWLEIGGKVVPGGYVLFSDEQFQPAGIKIRITGVKDYINNPHKPEITLSNAPVSSSFGSTLGKLEADEVVIEQKKQEAIQYSKRQWRDAKETMSMLLETALNFDKSINPMTVNTMQLLVGDENLQFRFVDNKVNPRRVGSSILFIKSIKRLTADAAILQHLTLGINVLSNSHKANEYKFWDIKQYLSPALDASKAYFLYAKCKKNGTTGVLMLSESAIKMEDFDDYYHFLVGILNSEVDGDRSFAPLYGFSEILPGRITTDKIISQDGKTYFDLVRNIIAGNIRFLSTTGEEVDLLEWTQSTTDEFNAQITSISNNVAGLEQYVDGAFKDGIISESEAKAIEKYINVINSEKADFEATYNKVYANENLTGTVKSNLLNAKISLFGAISALLYAINTAIADSKTTIQEKQNVDAKYSTYKTKIADFKTALEIANKEIQQNTIDNLEVGGVNYVKNGNFLSGLDFWNKNYNPSEPENLRPEFRVIYKNLPANTASALRVTTKSAYQGVWQKFTNVLELNKVHTLSFIARSRIGNTTLSVGHEGALEQVPLTGAWMKYKIKFTPTQHRNVVFYAVTATEFYITNIQLERGSVATGYTNYPFIEKAISGSTDINGGLLLGNILGVKDQVGGVTAGMNGLQTSSNDIRFWAGAPIEEMETAPFRIYEDGRIALENIKGGKEISILNENINDLNSYLGNFGVQTLKEETEAFYIKRIDYYSGCRFPDLDNSHGGSQGSSSDHPDTPNFTYRENIQTFTLNTASQVWLNVEACVEAPSEYETAETVAKIINTTTGDVVEEIAEQYHFIEYDQHNYQKQLFFNKRLERGTYKVICSAKLVYADGRKNDFYYYSKQGEGGGNSSIYVLARIGEIKAQSNTYKVFLRSNGMLCAGDVNEYFYLRQKAGDYFLQLMGKMLFKTPNGQSSLYFSNDTIRVQGKTDMPGLLACGSASKNGTINNRWGRLNPYKGVQRRSQGVYWIQHAIGHREYSVSLCPHVENTIATVNNYTRREDYVEVIITQNGNKVDCGFDFQIFGHN